MLSMLALNIIHVSKKGYWTSKRKEAEENIIIIIIFIIIIVVVIVNQIRRPHRRL